MTVYAIPYKVDMEKNASINVLENPDPYMRTQIHPVLKENPD